MTPVRWITAIGLGVVAASVATADITNITQGTTHATIQEAIIASSHGDEIVVDPGTYNESNIHLAGKAITLRSQDPLDASIVTQTVLGGTYDPVFHVNADEGPDTVISGFAFTNMAGYDSAIDIVEASPTISHCTFQDNLSEVIGGAAIFAYMSSSTITGCAFLGNVSESSPGGALRLYESSPTIRDCLFDQNVSMFWPGGAIAVEYGSATIERCRFRRNTTVNDGGALLVRSSDVTLVDCAFFANEVPGRGAAIYVDEGGHASIIGTRIESNECGIEGGGIHLAVDGVDTCSLQDSVVVLNVPDQIEGAYDDLGGNAIGLLTAPPRVTVETCPEDINGDGVVDLSDLGALLAVFDQPCP